MVGQDQALHDRSECFRILGRLHPSELGGWNRSATENSTLCDLRLQPGLALGIGPFLDRVDKGDQLVWRNAILDGKHPTSLLEFCSTVVAVV